MNLEKILRQLQDYVRNIKDLDQKEIGRAHV